ncbi:MAG: type IV toxin-antitoxin system AbiEi family antitoxin domain-containing protein [Elusimicrobiota bacterium]|jgi:predicted transcriptional regulator of viral defense system
MRTDPVGNHNRLFAIASGQAGYFTAQQAKSAGYYKRLQHYHRQRGSWLPIEHGVFRLRNFPGTPWEDLVRWSLWSRNQKGEMQATVSHQSAAQFYELADYLPMKVHLTVPRSFRKRIKEGCVIHRVSVQPEEIETHDGFRVTTPLRTLRDLAREDGERDQLLQAVEEAVRRGLITRAQKESLHLS